MLHLQKWRYALYDRISILSRFRSICNELRNDEKTSRRICRAFTMVLSLGNWQRTLHLATRRQCNLARLRRENLLSLPGQRVTTIVRMCFIVSGDVVDLPEEIGVANKRSSCYCDGRRQSELVVNRALSLYCRVVFEICNSIEPLPASFPNWSVTVLHFFRMRAAF